MSAENRLTSIVSYPERGAGGNNRYRGNCSPKLIEDLIGFFKPAEICDYMCGSGTTQDAAHTMGIIRLPDFGVVGIRIVGFADLF